MHPKGTVREPAISLFMNKEVSGLNHDILIVVTILVIVLYTHVYQVVTLYVRFVNSEIVVVDELSGHPVRTDNPGATINSD